MPLSLNIHSNFCLCNVSFQVFDLTSVLKRGVKEVIYTLIQKGGQALS